MIIFSKARIILKCILIGLLLGVVSCSKESDAPPSTVLEACFSVPATINTGQVVVFNSDCSKNAKTYLWEFGDEGTSTVESPSYTFSVSGTYVVKLTIGDGAVSETISKQLIVVEGGSIDPIGTDCIAHSGIITQDEVWKTGETHCINGLFQIKGATLTIEPGVTVKISKTAFFEVGGGDLDSALVAIGEPDNPILFTSQEDHPQPGDWTVIVFTDQASEMNILKHCIVEYGGSQLYSSSNVSMVELLSGGHLSIENTEFRHGLTHAFEMDSYSSLLSFNGNKIWDVGDYSIKTNTLRVHQLGSGNIIENKGIWVESILLTENVSWKKQPVPYYMSNGLTVGSQNGNTLTLESGVDIRFGPLYNNAVQIGFENIGTNYPYLGSLIALGTVDDPIYFRSASDTPSAGDWRGVNFGPSSSQSSSVNHLTIAHAQSTTDISSGVLEINSPRISLDNILITDCIGNGLIINAAPLLADNITVDIQDGYPLISDAIFLDAIGDFTAANLDYPIYVTAKQNLKGRKFVIKNRVLPYFFAENTYIGTNTYDLLTSTEVAIDPGAILTFAPQKGFIIGYSSPVVFKAEGTSENPITFTAYNPGNIPSTENWGGLHFGNHTTTSSLINCDISFGGYRSQFAPNANVTVSHTVESDLLIRDSQLTNSYSYGIYLSNSSPVLENLTYGNNTAGDLEIWME